MRPPLSLLILLPLLGGCDAFWGPFAAANVASLTVTGRAVPDLVVSGVTGRDCSIAHLDDGEKHYCRRDPLPSPAPVCTRSLGSIDCWAGPPPGAPPTRLVGDAPPAPPERAREPWPFNSF